LVFRNVQQRLSYSLLSDIAAALLDEAVFTIVSKFITLRVDTVLKNLSSNLKVIEININH